MKTSKGNELPIMNIRGKPYLQVAHRLVWLSDDVEHYEIRTEILKMEKDESVVRAIVITYAKQDPNSLGLVSRTATATKRETSQGFNDHLEKAETGAIGRALAMLGFGTQFTGDEMAEGDRLADAPTQNKTTTHVIQNYTQVKPPAPVSPLANHATKGNWTPTPKQVGLLLFTAEKNGWPKDRISAHLEASYGVLRVNSLDKEAFDESLAFFKDNPYVPGPSVYDQPPEDLFPA